MGAPLPGVALKVSETAWLTQGAVGRPWTIVFGMVGSRFTEKLAIGLALPAASLAVYS